jgi:hypothetical protein
MSFSPSSHDPLFKPLIDKVEVVKFGASNFDVFGEI